MLLPSHSGDVGHSVMSLLSHAGNGAAEVTLVMAQCCCQVMQVMVPPWQSWPWHDVATESC
jgi:hypothetical protein